MGTETDFILNSFEEASKDDEAIRLYESALKRQEVEDWIKKLTKAPLERNLSSILSCELVVLS